MAESRKNINERLSLIPVGCTCSYCPAIRASVKAIEKMGWAFCLGIAIGGVWAIICYEFL